MDRTRSNHQPWQGGIRHTDASYDETIEFAEKNKVKVSVMKVIA